MLRYGQLETAFEKIRASTGQSDVSELVNKFLNREQTYATLLTQVSQNEKLLTKLKHDNDSKKEELIRLKMENEDGKTKESEKIENKDHADVINEIEELERQLTIINERKKNIHLIGDKVYGWANRVNTKLNLQLSDDY